MEFFLYTSEPFRATFHCSLNFMQLCELMELAFSDQETSNCPLYRAITPKLGVIKSQVYRFLRLCSSKVFFVSQMVSLSFSVPSLSLFVLSFSFSFPFLSFFVSLSGYSCRGLLLASSMADSSRCFQNCSRNSVRCLSLAFTHCRKLMKSVGKLW
jgi:hypothetical protein